MPEGCVFVIANKLEITCGISSHLYYLLRELGDYSRNNIILISGGGNAMERYGSLVFKLIELPAIQHEKRSIIGFVKAVIALRKLINEYHPRVIHAHHFYAANIAAYAKTGEPVKTLQSVHGLIPDKGKLPHYRADLIIGVNEHIEKQIEEEGKPSDFIMLVRYGYPFYSNSAKDENGKTLKILTASRLVFDKGIDTFLSSIKLLGEHSSNFTFTIAGSGKDESFFREQASGLAVEFLGDVPDLFEKLDEYDVLVNPTRSSMEGFPTIVIQAASKKLAVISTKFPGYQSQLNENNALLTEIDDAQGIADALLMLYADRQLLRRKQETIFNDFVNIYNVEFLAKTMKAIYSGKRII